MIELELEDGGKIRVRVDTEGERAVSDVVDPVEFIQNICTTAGMDCVVGTGEMTILTPSEADFEPEEGESAQEDNNV